MFSQFGLPVKSFNGHLKTIFTYSVFVNLLVLAPSIHMLQVYDRVLSSNSVSTLVYLTLIVVFLLLFFGLAEFVRARIAQRLSAAYAVEMAPKLFAKLSGGNGDKVTSGKIMRDFSSVRGFLSGKPFVSLFDLPFIPLYLAIMFLLHWTLGVFVLISIVLMISVSVISASATEVERNDSRKADSDAVNYSLSVLELPEEMRTFGTGAHFETMWRKRLAKALVTSEGAGNATSGYQAMSKTLRQTLQVGVMALGGYLAVTGAMSAGMIFMASMVAGKALAPIDQLTGGWEQIAKAVGSMRELKDFVADMPAEEDPVRIPQITGTLKATDVVWSPDASNPERIILDSISLTIRPGEVTIITGSTGSGKTALMRILAGAIAATEGRVTLDGLDAKAWPSDQWAKLVGYVPQEITFFPGTVAANIARFDPAASGEAIVEATQLAGAHAMIMRLPEGYATRIGAGGIPLSSGQKQMIALARAHFSKPRCLILDEPNAHLDAAGEEAMMQSLSAAKNAGTSIIMTAHRNTVMRIAEHVFMLQDGRLARLALKGPQPLQADDAQNGVSESPLRALARLEAAG